MTGLCLLLAAGACRLAFAQPQPDYYDPNSWDNSEYGIHGRADLGTYSFCNHGVRQYGAAPTLQEAVESFVCAEDRLILKQGPLILVDNVKIQIGAPRPFDKVADKLPEKWRMGLAVDERAPVYPLKGSFTLYECASLKTSPQSAGKNCNAVEESEQAGVCYKHPTDIGDPETHGQWQCRMNIKVEYWWDRKAASPDQAAAFRKEWDNQWTHRGVPPPLVK